MSNLLGGGEVGVWLDESDMPLLSLNTPGLTPFISSSTLLLLPVLHVVDLTRRTPPLQSVQLADFYDEECGEGQHC